MLVPHGYSQVIKTYGNPVGIDGDLNKAWEQDNIVTVTLPYEMTLAGTTTKVTRCRIHKKCASSLVEALTECYNYARKEVKKQFGYNKSTTFYDVETLKYLRSYGLTVFGGAFVFRRKRGSSGLSMHSFGIAIDIDPQNNPLGAKVAKIPKWFIDIFQKHGALNGIKFKGRKDPMHFQWATGC